MARQLNSKVIVITGASSGIGAATAIQAAEAGMKVVLAARRADRLQAVADQIHAAGGESLVIPTDVARDDDVAQLTDRTLESFGRIDAMLANAGYGFLNAVDATSDDAHRRIFETNYWGTVRCVRSVIPIMQQQRSGHILIVSSIVGRIGLPYHAAYSATKSAQDTLAMGLRVELAFDQIDVSCVYPVTTDTEFFEVSASIGRREPGQVHAPGKFVQSPQTVARAIMRCLRKPKPEVWPAPLLRWGAGLALLMPRLTQRSLVRHAKKDRKRLPPPHHDATAS
ncbi:MAG: hypothetical protein CMJ49_00865 [Planctomycetaceae bacterium]|nr:hypothetical protein [Planctomycetaceae bacterium]